MSLFKDLMADVRNDEDRPTPFEQSPKNSGSVFRELMSSARPMTAVYPTIDTRGVKPIEAPPDSTVDVVLDALAAGVGAGEEHFGELTGLKNFTEEGRAMKERNLHQYEDNSFDYHLQNILMSAPESAAIMAASMGTGALLGGPVGALGGAARGILSQSPRMASLMWNLAKAYQGGSTAAKVARTVIPSTPQTAIAVETGALMEAQVEGLEAEKRYIENAKANGTYVEGQTEAEAAEVRSNVVRDNIGIISMFNAPQYQAIMGRPARSLLGKLGRFGAAAGSEGAEEVAQELASAYELGESPQWRNLRDAAIAGTAMGAGFHGIGRGVPYALDRIAGRPTYEELEDQRKASAKEFNEQESALYNDFRSAVENFANRQERGARQSYREAQQENLTQKQAEIWDAAQYASQRAKEKYNIDLSPELVYKQWAHEAGVNFDSPNARYNNNFGGLTQSEPNGEENKQPDGNNYYRHFNSVQEYAEAYVDDYIRHRPKISGVKNEREFAQVMHDTGYFTDSVNNYTAGMEGISAPTSRTDGEQTRGGNVYTGEKGGGEGKYWARQNDGVSFDGAQPQLLDAVDMLAKWYHDKTGKRLVVTAGTNGDHAQGEHSHSAGWKVDVNDFGFGEEGALTTEDGSKGTLTDEFIAYGRSLGLGMNWEGDHIDVALDGTQWDGNGENVGGFNPQRGQSVQSRANEIFTERTRNDEAPQWQDYKQNEKPLFDINAEDETTQKLFEQYAEERLVNSTDRDTVNFFDGMFTADGNFQNTPENRDAIRERYGNDFIKWVTNQQNQQNQQTTQEEKSAQSNSSKTQPPTQTNSPLRNAPVIETATKFLEQLRAKGDPQNLKTALNLQSAISNGDIATVENILKQNNITIPTPQTQTENVVKENTTPENVTKQKTSLPERQIKTARAPVATGSKNKGRRVKQGNAIIALATENKIEIPGGEVVALQNGSTKAVQKWRDTLLESGILDLPQTQSTLQNQEQTLQADKTSQQANPQQQSQVQTQSTSQNQQTTLQEIQAARENWENTKRGYQERGEKIQAARREQREKEDRQLRERQAKEEEEIRRDTQGVFDLIPTVDEFDNVDEGEEVEPPPLTPEEQWRNKQIKENVQLRERQAEKKRLAQERRRQDEQREQDRQEQINQNARQQQVENIKVAAGLPRDSAKATEQVAFAMSEPSANVETRKRQGTVLANILSLPQLRYSNNAIETVAGLEKALENGSTKAILKAQEVLNAIEAPKEQVPQVREKIHRPKTQTEIEQERRQREQKKRQGQSERNQRREEEELNREIAREEAWNQDTFEDELQGDDEMYESRIQQAEDLEEIFANEPTEDSEESSAQQSQETPQPQTQSPQENQPQAQEQSQERPSPQYKSRMRTSERVTERAKQNKSRPKQAKPETEGVYGDEAEAETLTDAEHQVRYKVVEASDLTISHRREGLGVVKNGEFPDELQPRDRERTDMQQRIIEMISKLVPKKLLDLARSVNLGMPVVRKDGVVLNGNGRALAVLEAYKEGKAEHYKDALIDNAHKFGLNASKIARMKQPILIRELVRDDLSLAEQKDIAATTSGGAGMSASEQARADAKKINPQTIASFPQGEVISLNLAKLTAAAKDFLRAVLQDIITRDEVSAYTDKNGRIAQNGIDRAIQALVAYAYDNDAITARVTDEKADDDIKTATAALIEAAPEIARVQAAMDNGTLHSYNLDAIAEAAEKLSSLKDEGMSVTDYLNEGTLGDMGLSAEAREILQFLDRNKRSSKKIAEFLKNLAQGIREQGNPNQGGLFGEVEAAPLMNLIKSSRQEVEGKGEQDLFAQQEEKSNGTTSEETATEESSRTEENSDKDTVSRQTQAQEVIEPQTKSESKPKTLFKGEKEIKKARQTIEEEVPAGTKVRVKAIPTTGSKETIETHYIIGEGFIQRVDEDGNPIGKEYSRNRSATTKFFVRDTKGNGYSVAELEIEYPNSQAKSETKTETKPKTAPEVKTESKPAEKTPYDEFHEKLKTDKHPRLKAWLDKLVNGAGSERTALFRLRTRFGKKTFTDNQLDNAEKNLIAYEKEHGELTDKLDFEAHEYPITDEDINEAVKDLNTAKVFKQLGAKIKNGKVTFSDEDSRQACIDYMKTIGRKASLHGTGDTTFENVVDPEDLTAQQKIFKRLGNDLGIHVIFFDNPNGDFHGAYVGNVCFVNVNSKMPLTQVFWHESAHWLRANNPELWRRLVKAAGITSAQRQAYLDETERTDLKTDAAIDEEIIADYMQDALKREGFLSDIGRKDPSLIQRVIAWLQDMLSKFKEYFRNPQGKLTNEQANRIAHEIGRSARNIVNQHGDKIFRYNRRTHTTELATGEKLPIVDTVTKGEAAQTKKALAELAKAAWDDKNFNGKVSFTPSKKFRDKAQEIFGHDVDTVFITGSDIRHIKSHHGSNEEQRGQVNMTPDSIAEIYDIVNNFSSAKRERDDNKGNKTLSVVSEDGLGYTLLIERGKSRAQVRTSFKWKNPQVLDVTSPKPNVRNDPADSSADNITQSEPEDNAALAREFGGRIENGQAVFDNAKDEAAYQQLLADMERGDIKYSLSSSDNSTESFSRRVRNKVSALFDTSSQNTRRNKAIKDTLSKLSGYRILFGHTNSDEVIVDDLQKIIQSKHAYDLEKLLPKVGGKIASNLNLDATDEMNNYIADWLLTGALNNTSAEAKAFAKAMRDNPAQSELLQVVRDTFQEFADMTPFERIKSTIVRRQEKPLPQRAKEIISREEWIDDLNPLQKVVDRMIEQSSPEVADIIKQSIDPYKMARLLKGTGALADMMIGEHGDDLVKIRKALQTQYPNVNFDNFKTLSSIIKSVGGDLEGLEAYALAKLDKEIHEKNRAGKTNITPSFSEEQDDAAIKEGEKKFGQAQKDLVEYSRTLLAMQYSAGLITQNKFYAYLNGWQNYIPTPRVFDEDETFDIADSFKQKQGSKRDTFSPIQKLAANTQVFLRQAERNKVKLQIATLARFGNFGNIIAEVEKSNPDIKTVIRFKENGKMKYLETPDLALVRAVESLQTQADGNVIIQAAKITMSFMRAAYTSLNPDFAAGNAFRDLADAYIHNRHLNANPILALLDMWRAGFKGIVTKDQDYYDWLASGGSQSGFVTESANTSERAIENLTRDSRKGNYFSKAWNKFQYLIELSENVTRLNTYKAAKKNLAAKHGGAATVTDMRLAALAARDASVDFARSGKSMRTANKFILFSNAAVQGLWLWGEKLRPSKLKTKEGQKEIFSAAFRAVMMGVMPAIIQSALNYGDDDRRKKYENRPDWEKDTYWIFGDGVRVPKGMDLGIRTLSALTDEVVDWLVKNDPVELNRIFRNLGGGFPSLTATIFTPAIESYANYSFFRDAPIVPYREQSLPKYLQYGAETSWVAKQLGEIINFSPRKIDYLISGYLGFMGRFATNPSLDVDRFPVVRRFFFDPDKNPKIVKDYYNALNEQEELYRGYKFERDRGKKVDLPEDYDAGLHKRLKTAQKQMQALSKQERKLIEDEKLSSDEQKAKLRELEKRRVALCEKVFKRAQ